MIRIGPCPAGGLLHGCRCRLEVGGLILGQLPVPSLLLISRWHLQARSAGVVLHAELEIHVSGMFAVRE